MTYAGKSESEMISQLPDAVGQLPDAAGLLPDAAVQLQGVLAKLEGLVRASTRMEVCVCADVC